MTGTISTHVIGSTDWNADAIRTLFKNKMYETDGKHVIFLYSPLGAYHYGRYGFDKISGKSAKESFAEMMSSLRSLGEALGVSSSLPSIINSIMEAKRDFGGTGFLSRSAVVRALTHAHGGILKEVLAVHRFKARVVPNTAHVAWKDRISQMIPGTVDISLNLKPVLDNFARCEEEVLLLPAATALWDKSTTAHMPLVIPEKTFLQFVQEARKHISKMRYTKTQKAQVA